jgi:hypothetical protein
LLLTDTTSFLPEILLTTQQGYTAYDSRLYGNPMAISTPAFAQKITCAQQSCKNRNQLKLF